MLDRQEYDDLMSYLKPVFKKIWAHENDERQKVGKSLNAFQFGFPINNIWLYLTEKNGEKFYIILKSASNLNGNLNCSKELEHYAS